VEKYSNEERITKRLANAIQAVGTLDIQLLLFNKE
jgi:hypothetical protein